MPKASQKKSSVSQQHGHAADTNELYEDAKVGSPDGKVKNVEISEIY